MKISILLRYPKIENSSWKRELIEELVKQKHDVSLVYGEASYFKHFKAALKEYGPGFLKRKKSPTTGEKKTNLYKHFKNSLPVNTVSNLNSTEAENIIKTINPEYLLLLGTGIMRKNILVLPSKGAVHCHHGHLPEYRGVSTAEWTLFHGDDIYLSTHYVDPGIDTGDIILRTKVPLEPNDTIDKVRLKCRVYSVQIILETFKLLETNNVKQIAQTVDEGKQYFFMHPFFKHLVNRKLNAGS